MEAEEGVYSPESVQEKKKFEIGKWYKANAGVTADFYYLKVNEVYISGLPYGEGIINRSGDKVYIESHHWNNSTTIKQALEIGPIDVAEIQKWLPEGHVDKKDSSVSFKYPDKIIALKTNFGGGGGTINNNTGPIVRKGDIGVFIKKVGEDAIYSFPNFSHYYVIEQNFTSGTAKEYCEESVEERPFVFPKNIIALVKSPVEGSIKKGEIGVYVKDFIYDFPSHKDYIVNEEAFKDKLIAEYYIAPNSDTPKFVRTTDCTSTNDTLEVLKINPTADSLEDRFKLSPKLKSDLIFLKNKPEDDRILI